MASSDDEATGPRLAVRCESAFLRTLLSSAFPGVDGVLLQHRRVVLSFSSERAAEAARAKGAVKVQGLPVQAGSPPEKYARNTAVLDQGWAFLAQYLSNVLKSHGVERVTYNKNYSHGLVAMMVSKEAASSLPSLGMITVGGEFCCTLRPFAPKTKGKVKQGGQLVVKGGKDESSEDEATSKRSKGKKRVKVPKKRKSL
eukprot:RCo010584